MESMTCQFGSIFGFCHVIHLLPAVFRKSFLLQRISDLLALQAAHTDAPWKNYRQLPSAAILSVFFLSVHVPDIIIKLNNQKTASRNKMSINFYIPQWTVENTRTNTMVTPCQKNARHVFMFSSDQYKKCARRGSVLQATFVPHSASSRVILIG